MVLIETLWNVKEAIIDVFTDDVYVLIETLWNVKDENAPVPLIVSPGFNRNIVECKVRSWTLHLLS